jgi:uncharacterized protein (DUF58 family)|nr:MAG: hypothetical protein KatS3mg041_0881 [Bacteroidota bacterium]
MSRETRTLLDPRLISRIKNFELRARLIVEGFITGLHRSPYHGFSVEFAEHRAYHPGDELRYVDWKVYGKSDRFYVKQYLEETNVRAYMLLDTSSSMRYRFRADFSKLAYAAHLAAALQYLMLLQRDAVGLVIFDEAIRSWFPARSAPAYRRVLLRQLEALLADASSSERRRTNAAAALHEVAERLRRRSLVIVLTDLLEEDPEALLAALRHLRYRKHEVILFHILEEAAERKLELPNQPVILEDVETGETLPVHPGALRGAYQEAVRRFMDTFRRRCRENRIDFVELDTATPYDVALLHYLGRRSKLF